MSFQSEVASLIAANKHSKEATDAIRTILDIVEIHLHRLVDKTPRRKAPVAPSGATPSSPAVVSKVLRSYTNPDLRSSLAETVMVILKDSIDSTQETIKDLADALETGISNEEYISMTADHHLPALLTNHPDADPVKLRADLQEITRALLGDLNSQIRALVDRLIAAKKEAHKV